MPSQENQTEDYPEIFLDNLKKCESHFWYKSRNRIIYNTIEEINLKKPLILEAGAGTGIVASFLKNKGYDVEACDFYKKSVEILRSIIGNSYVWDIRNPITSEYYFNRYDVIIVGDVIEHLDNPGEALKNCCNLLKPNGYLIVTVPAMPCLWSAYDEGGGHKRRYTKKTLRDELLDAKLTVVSCDYFMMIVGFMLLLTRKLIPSSIKPRLIKNHSEQLVVRPLISHRIMDISCKIEELITRCVSLPFGSSLIAVAKRG